MIVFGASGHCKVILDILMSNNIIVDKILDDHPIVKEIYGISVLRSDECVIANQNAIIAIGSNSVRKLIAEKHNFKYDIAIHPKSSVSRKSKIGEGTVVMANANINSDALVGRHCIINTGSVVEHDSKIGDYVHISPNAALAGNVEIGEGTHIGIGSTIIQGIKIGKWCTIGAGAVIIRDVPDFCTVVGNPGKIIKITNK